MEKNIAEKEVLQDRNRDTFIENSLFDQGRNSDFALEFHVEIRFRLFFITKIQ